MKKLLLTACLLLCISIPLMALDYKDGLWVQVNHLGFEGGAAYFDIIEGWASTGLTPVGGYVVYIDLNSVDGKAMYATLLAAKSNGWRISRIGFTGAGLSVLNNLSVAQP